MAAADHHRQVSEKNGTNSYKRMTIFEQNASGWWNRSPILHQNLYVSNTLTKSSHVNGRSQQEEAKEEHENALERLSRGETPGAGLRSSQAAGASEVERLRADLYV